MGDRDGSPSHLKGDGSLDWSTSAFTFGSPLDISVRFSFESSIKLLVPLEGELLGASLSGFTLFLPGGTEVFSFLPLLDFSGSKSVVGSAPEGQFFLP